MKKVEAEVKVSLWCKKEVWKRPYVLPFLALYAVVAGVFFEVFQIEDSSKRSIAEFISIVTLCLVGFLHALCFLFTLWSVRFRCFSNFQRASYGKATHALAEPPQHHGSSALCPLIENDHFEFQKLHFIRNKETGNFEALAYPDSLPLKQYHLSPTAIGMTNERSKEALKEFGANRFDIPEPSFWELYKEQAKAPFFVFQIFCVGLWSLDEHPQYAFFMLFMLLLFEATVVKSRIANLSTLRTTVSRSSCSVNVFRSNHWLKISSDELVPGDIFSIVSSSSTTNSKDNSNKEKSSSCPCDALLLSGTVVVNEAMLTGESTPHLKESISSLNTADDLSLTNTLLLPDTAHKNHVVFAGTQILQTTATNTSSSTLNTPDGGCIGFVLRTGFGTSQGSLMRTILFASERVTANNRESFAFIAILLVFAIIASGYVMRRGLSDPNRSRWKLLLNCSLIITSVVPPELPMELSLAVNTSLLALRKLFVFCTEPFRIPFAGALNTCCFDKTGTLTSDDLHLRGIVGASGRSDPEENVIDPNQLSDETLSVLAGCHSLISVDGKLLGDPIEIAALQSIGWTISNTGERALEKAKHGSRQRSIRLVQRLGFNSVLRRMSTVISFTSATVGQPERFIVACKGAPESIRPLLAVVPDFYDGLYEKYAAQGGRVLALATKQIPQGTSGTELRTMSRETFESGLTFEGFAVFECTIKPESAPTITALKKASLGTVMITGDNTLTACHVAHETGIAEKPLLVLTLANDPNELIWKEVTGNQTFKLLEPLSQREFDLCVGGDTLDIVLNDALHAKSIITRTVVFSRVAPEQKEKIIAVLKSAGRTTLMCGDGTNDVGALRQAEVGVALLIPPPTSVPNHHNTKFNQQQQQRNQKAAISTPISTPSTSSSENRKREMEKKRQELMEELSQQDAPAVAKLGDASIASPFTCRSFSIAPVLDIVRQGRCTLVSTHQMYRILALNSLVSAYTLSALYFESVKMGDMQSTAIGMLIAFCFMFVSWSKPLPKLSKQKPISGLFHPSMLLSVFLQSAVHLAAIIYSLNLAKSALPPDTEPEDPDAPFKPTLINSAVFLVSCAMQVSSFVVNHRGHPFMQSLIENKGLGICLGLMSIIMWLSALEISPEWNTFLELVPFPTPEFRYTIIAIMALDLILTWILDRIICLIFRV